MQLLHAGGGFDGKLTDKSVIGVSPVVPCNKTGISKATLQIEKSDGGIMIWPGPKAGLCVQPYMCSSHACMHAQQWLWLMPPSDPHTSAELHLGRSTGLPCCRATLSLQHVPTNDVW